MTEAIKALIEQEASRPKLSWDDYQTLYPPKQYTMLALECAIKELKKESEMYCALLAVAQYINLDAFKNIIPEGEIKNNYSMALKRYHKMRDRYEPWRKKN